jgi:hypothetical protein
MKVTGLKAFIYADDNMKKLITRLAHWERESKNYSLQINFKKTVMSKQSIKEKKT